MEEAYSEFAYSYDMFMDNIPYESWGKYICELLMENGIRDGLVLELGCGTGNMTEILAGAGYDMIGIDISDDMLNIALEKKYESGHDILYLNQDMRDFELYGTVRAVVSVCDSVNYILNEEEVLKTFKLVNNYLDPGGIFIFDMITEKKFVNIGDSTIADNRDDASFIWENTYYKEEKINRYDLTIFEKSEDGRYDRYDETHYQRVYDKEVIQKLLEEAGLEFVTAYNAISHDYPDNNSERIYYIAKEIQKERHENE